jgi:hypothetical protein
MKNLSFHSSRFELINQLVLKSKRFTLKTKENSEEGIHDEKSYE